MTKPHDVDFRFQIWPHGWSSACIWIDGHPTEFRLTHVFSDPLEALIKSAIGLAAGDSSATIEWSEEPGAYLIQFERLANEHHLLAVQIDVYIETQPVKSLNTAVSTSKFIVARDYWLHLVEQEIAKIASNLRFQHYRDHREYNFPNELYATLRSQLMQHKSTRQ